MSNNQIQNPVAIALIRNEQGKFFVQKRNIKDCPSAYNKWEFPGGGVDFGGHPEDAIKREVKEEINCEVEVMKLLPYIHSNIWDYEDGSKMHVIILCYECRIIKGEPSPNHVEVGEIRWVDIEEAKNMDLLAGNLEYMQMA